MGREGQGERSKDHKALPPPLRRNPLPCAALCLASRRCHRIALQPRRRQALSHTMLRLPSSLASWRQPQRLQRVCGAAPREKREGQTRHGKTQRQRRRKKELGRAKEEKTDQMAPAPLPAPPAPRRRLPPSHGIDSCFRRDGGHASPTASEQRYRTEPRNCDERLASQRDARGRAGS